MAPQVFTDIASLIWAHPVIAGMSLIFFTPPFWPILRYFSPLLISTALFMLALFTMGPKSGKDGAGGEGEDWEQKSVADRHGDGESCVPRRRKPDGSWMDWVRSIEESSLSFMSPRAKLKRENWKGGAENDENVSVLEEASWAKGGDFSSYEQGGSGFTAEASASLLVEENLGNSFLPTLIAPSMLFKVDSGLDGAPERSIYHDLDLGEDAPELEDVEEPDQPETPPAPSVSVPETSDQSTSGAVQHQPMENLHVPQRTASGDPESGSPSTDLDSSDLDRSERLLPGLSDADTPVVENLSVSEKLHQMESLGDFIDDAEHAEETGQESPELTVLQPTTDEQVQAVKDQLENFVQKDEDGSVPPSPPKPGNAAEDAAATKPAGPPKGEVSEAR